MKNTILTFSNADNYGAVLQAYALQNFCEKIGIKTDIINYNPEYFDNKYNPYISFLRKKNEFINQGISLSFFRAFKAWLYNVKYPIRRLKHDAFEKFRKDELHMTYRCRTYQEVEKILKGYTSVCIGSDQVWSRRITGGEFDPVFFAHGIKDIKKIVYAASAGGTIDEEYFQEFEDLLKDIDYISVREESLRNQIITKSSYKSTVTVLDPVFLLEGFEWKKLLSEKKISNEKYIFVYNVSSKNSKKYFNLVEQIAQNNNLLIYEIGNKRNTKGEGKLFNHAGPKKFLELLVNAELVFTTSFHATALSIILKKEFLVYKPNNASRIITILNNIDLIDRMIDPDLDSSMHVIENIDSQPIDFDEVSCKLKKTIDASQKYLINCFK